MARARVVKFKRDTHAPSLELRKPAPAAAARLAAGIHPAQIEMRSVGEPPKPGRAPRDAAYRVRAVTGEVVTARLADGIGEAFAEECMRDRRTVLVSAAGDGPAVILGALQTSSTASRDAHDTLRLSAKRIELDADDGISIHVGKSTLRLDRHGAVKIVGQKMTMDVASVVRVLSALVELP